MVVFSEINFGCIFLEKRFTRKNLTLEKKTNSISKNFFDKKVTGLGSLFLDNFSNFCRNKFYYFKPNVEFSANCLQIYFLKGSVALGNNLI